MAAAERFSVRIVNAAVRSPTESTSISLFYLDNFPSVNLVADTHSGCVVDVTGGANGDPLILEFVTPLEMTRLRVVALGQLFLHLGQVKLYSVSGTASVDQSGAGK
jgi:hypothetical protein